MKKLVLLLAVVFSASLFSCNNSKEEAAVDTLAADTVEVAVATDTVVAVDSLGDTAVVAETAAVVAE